MLRKGLWHHLRFTQSWAAAYDIRDEGSGDTATYIQATAVVPASITSLSPQFSCRVVFCVRVCDSFQDREKDKGVRFYGPGGELVIRTGKEAV